MSSSGMDLDPESLACKPGPSHRSVISPSIIAQTPKKPEISAAFKGELFFLVTQFLESHPDTRDVSEVLKKTLVENRLLPARHDWTGSQHVKSYEDLKHEVGPLPDEHLLKLCFQLTSLVPSTSSAQVRSLLGRKNLNGLQNSELLTPKTGGVLDLLHRRHYRSTQPSQRQWHSHLTTRLTFLRRTLGHLSGVYCLTYDRTGRYVFTGADDLLIKCWRVADGRLVHTFRGASSEISDLAVSHDNRLLAAGSCDKIIRVWCLQTAAPVAVLSKHTGTITAIHFCPFNEDGKNHYLASTSGDGTVSFWRYKYNDHDFAEFDEAPTRYHEKIRPGLAQMLCASFSPGGVFFCVGSADHNVRVYQMNHPDGPVRILEEELHTDRVACIQWCNRADELRFISGSKDGTAIIWTFKCKRWQTITLNMRGVDAMNTSGNNNARPKPRGGRNAGEGRQLANGSQQNSVANEGRVTMVAWSLDDSIAITAVSDMTLKLWNARTGKLISSLAGHDDEIFVLEPHPVSWNLLLSAAHDGQIFVWDMNTKKSVFRHKNMVDDQAGGHAAVFDAKWSPDGLTIAASDSHGHLLFVGHGSSEKYDKLPVELFFHTDYRPLLRDSFQNVVDEQTQVPPHLLPPPFLVDSEGSPYPAYIQKYVPGREKMTERDALVPGGPEPSFNINNPQPGPSRNAMLDGPAFREAPAESAESEEANNASDSNENAMQVENRDENQPGSSRVSSDNHILERRYIIRRNLDPSAVKNHLKECSAASEVETDVFLTEQSKVMSDHDYALSLATSREKHKKTKANNRRDRTAPSARPSRQEDVEEDPEDEEPNEVEENDRDNSSDESLDESDMSSVESTTEEDSSDHSYWGSDDQESHHEEKTVPPPMPPKKKTPPSKKKRHAAQRCRENMLKHPADISEEYSPSAWLSEAYPKKSPYFPQINDVLTYFKQGHQKYIDLVKSRKAYELNMKEQEWMKKKNISEVCLVKVLNIKFEIRPPRLCILKLALLNENTLRPTGEQFSIKYHDMNDVVDFLVLYDIYKSSKGKHWKNGDRIRCQIDDCWWKGTVKKVEHHDANKRSPFLSIFCHWDNGEKEFLSPWDIEALDSETAELPDGTPVTAEQLKLSLYQPHEEEWNSMGLETECRRISEALETIMQLAIAEPFNYPVDLTAYPEYMLDVEYPMDFNLVKSRIDNHFYRRIDSVLYDLKFIAANAASFNRPKSDIVRNAKIITKLALEIVKDSSKGKDDVSAMYHNLVESFEWSENDEEEEEEGEGSKVISDEDSEPPEIEARDRNQRKRKASSSSSSPPNLNPKKWKHDCNELLNRMVSHPMSVPFREPVSEIDFPDYHRCITTPMDISTVREFLLVGEYDSPLAFQKDVVLIFKNSRSYNTDPKSNIIHMTNKLDDWFYDEIRDIIHDWRRTTRRLAIAKSKHKSKKNKAVIGKGKGKGKGKSNRINRPPRPNSGDDEEDEQDDVTSEEEAEDSDFSPTSRSKPKPSRSARAKKKEESFDEDSEPAYDEKMISKRKLPRASSSSRNGPQPSTSKAVPTQANKVSPSTSNSSPETSGRRISSRVPKPPVRFRTEEESDEEKVLHPQRRASQRSSRPRTTMREPSDIDELPDLPAVAERPRRQRKPLRSENYSYFSDDDEDDLPLRRNMKKSPNKKSNSPSKKQEQTASDSDEEDDLPLARRVNRNKPSSSKSENETLFPQRAKRSRGRKQENVDTSTEMNENASTSEEDDKPLKRGSSRGRKAAIQSRRRMAELDEQSESDEKVERSRKSTINKAVKGRNQRRKKSDESDSEFHGSVEEESEFVVEDEDEEEEDVEDLVSDRDFVVDDDYEEEILPRRASRSRSRAGKKSRRSAAMQQKPNSSKRAAQALDSESERTSTRRPSRLSNRNSHVDGLNRRVGRRAAAKRSYYESDNEDSARENRRPRRTAAMSHNLRNGEYESTSGEDDDEDDDERPKKRRKPNPRII